MTAEMMTSSMFFSASACVHDRCVSSSRVDVYTESRLSSGEVARDVLRGSGGREGAREPQKDHAAALAALREVHRPARNDSQTPSKRSINSKELHRRRGCTLGREKRRPSRPPALDRRALQKRGCSCRAPTCGATRGQAWCTSPIKALAARALRLAGFRRMRSPCHPSVNPSNALRQEWYPGVRLMQAACAKGSRCVVRRVVPPPQQAEPK